MLEASILSVNPNLYGDLHNFGHIAIALSHDPDHRHLETFSVMGDSATAMRDPIFYRWHSFINDIFDEHKRTLPPYTTNSLDFSGVRMTGAEILTDDRTTGYQGKNQIFTFWQQSDVDFSNGLDFAPRGPILARFTHLQHAPFVYRFTVESNASTTCTVRIFMAPKFDERGLPYLLRDQKNLFVEMDRFQKRLTKGKNTVTRRSDESSVTIPFARTFRDLDAAPAAVGDRARFDFCGCGWPQHMLIPKGNTAGFPAQLFVMVTDFRQDQVEGADPTGMCDDSTSFCGLRDRKYPDRKSMGFPFDRMPRAGIDTLAQFLTPNMFVQDCSIRFTERTFTPTKRGLNSRVA